MNRFLHDYSRCDAARSAAVADRLEAGESAATVAADLGMSPAALVAAVARASLGDDQSVGLPLVHGPVIRPELAAILADEATLADLLPGSARPARLALSAGLLQTLDAWDASHHAAQAADDLGEAATSAAWHMIAHRREPDPGNARYWARRIKPGTIDPTLVALAAPLLNSPAGLDLDLPGRLVWNPLTMIDLVGRVPEDSPAATLLRRLQRLEMLVLLGQSAALDV